MTPLPKSTFETDVIGKVLLQHFNKTKLRKGDQNVSRANFFLYNSQI